MFEGDSATTTMKSKNRIQNHIESMFKDIEANLVPDLGTHLFPVYFVGAINLSDRVTSLHGLQKPLRELILKKRPQQRSTTTSNMNTVLEINCNGIKWGDGDGDGGGDEKFGFSAIAVWSAVKFVKKNNKYAFVPLICDPDTEEKNDLFVELNDSMASFDWALNRPLFTGMKTVLLKY